MSLISAVFTHSSLYIWRRWGSVGCIGGWKVSFSSCFSIISPDFLARKRPFLSHIPWHTESPVAADCVRSAARYHFKALILHCCGQPKGWWVLWAQISSGRLLAPWVLLTGFEARSPWWPEQTQPSCQCWLTFCWWECLCADLPASSSQVELLITSCHLLSCKSWHLSHPSPGSVVLGGTVRDHSDIPGTIWP